MRPDDRLPFDDLLDGGMDLPFDAELEALNAELDEAGRHARRSLHGQTQPTRVFGSTLRAKLIGAVAVPAVVDAGALLPRSSVRSPRTRLDLVAAGETWAPVPLSPHIANRTPQVMPRARWALLAAATLTSVIVAGTLGARLDWLIPTPVDLSSQPPSSAAPTARPTPNPSAVVFLPVESPEASADPSAPVGPTDGPTPSKTPQPDPTKTPRPDPTPTPKPEPTKPPIGTMDLAVKACPGGVILDWTKPSPLTSHYHALRSLEGEVPATYPAPGTTEVESATSWSAGVTDGFDDSIGGGKTATYRVFAFDGADEVMAWGPAKTVTTLDRLSMGGLDVTDDGPGTITVSWTPPTVNAACFTYGKLVASIEDPEPSYLKGSAYLAAISDPSQGQVTIENLESGTSYWIRYEFIRVTGTGKFVVASSDVRQVLIP